MSNPIEPTRLAQLMDEAVAHIRVRPDALAAIHRGVRRRRAARFTATAVAVAVAVAGGVVAYGLAHGGMRATPSATRPPSVLRATIVPVGNPRTTNNFQLVVSMSTGGTQTVPFTAQTAVVMPPKGPVVVGIADAGPDRQAAIFVLVDSGAATEFWTIFTPVHGRVTQATMSGRPLSLSVGGSVLVNSGFACGAGGDLVSYGYSNANSADTSWNVQRSTYRWAGASLVLVSRMHRTIRASASSPQLAQYAFVRCGGLPQYAPR
jgi:hypothetical protein